MGKLKNNNNGKLYFCMKLSLFSEKQNYQKLGTFSLRPFCKKLTENSALDYFVKFGTETIFQP
jgi:hypothetical protein